jgi:hypothetical protein
MIRKRVDNISVDNKISINDIDKSLDIKYENILGTLFKSDGKHYILQTLNINHLYVINNNNININTFLIDYISFAQLYNLTIVDNTNPTLDPYCNILILDYTNRNIKTNFENNHLGTFYELVFYLEKTKLDDITYFSIYRDSDNYIDFTEYLKNNGNNSDLSYYYINDISSYYISERLCHTMSIRLPIYNSIIDIDKTVLFVGIYNDMDYKYLSNHRGNIYLVWTYDEYDMMLDKYKNYMNNINTLNIYKLLTTNTNLFPNLEYFEYLNTKSELIHKDVIRDAIKNIGDMDVNHIYISTNTVSKFIGDQIAQQYKLSSQPEYTKPVLFYGLYSYVDYNILKLYTASIYLVWTSLLFAKKEALLKNFKHLHQNVIHLSIDHETSKILRLEYNINCHYIVINIETSIVPNLDGRSILILDGDNTNLVLDKKYKDFSIYPTNLSDVFIAYFSDVDDKNYLLYQKILKVPIVNSLPILYTTIDKLKGTRDTIILIYCDYDLSITERNTVWFSKFINTLSNESYKLCIFCNTTVSSTNFTRNLDTIINIQSINTTEPYNIYKTYVIAPYNYTNITHSDTLIYYVDDIKEFSDKMGISKKYLRLKLSLDYKYTVTPNKKTENAGLIKLAYVGTLSPENKTLELLTLFNGLVKSKSNLQLVIIYSRIHGDDIFYHKLNNILNSDSLNIECMYNLSHNEVLEVLSGCHYGINWITNDNTNSGLTITWKDIEYTKCGLTILRSYGDILNIV